MVIFSVSGGFGLRSWTFEAISFPSMYHLHGWNMDVSALCARGEHGGTLGTAARNLRSPRSGPPLLQLLSFSVDHVGRYGAASIDPAFSRLEEHGFEQTASSSGSSCCVEDPAIAEDGPLGPCVRARQHGEILRMARRAEARSASGRPGRLDLRRLSR